MRLTDLLQQHHEEIVGKWFDAIIAMYPAGSAEFLAKQKDRFRNPVGYTTRASIEAVFDEITGSMDSGELRRALDDIVRVRAVQEFTAAEAVGFVFLLKPLLREVFQKHLGDQILRQEIVDEMVDLETRIDQVAMLTFDKYMECREQLHEVRTKEIRSRSANLIDSLNAGSCVSKCKGEPFNDDA
ncbi:MAG: RsbRD N-terminal domain-containing protein [Candidatus Latescibacterota bacterium]|nr:MAG: RsbRD N-terminal domain-containing protein [Candidatus Latescibacterota bacterium]